MKRSEFATSIVQSFQNRWQSLVEPSSELGELDRHLSRVLNAGLLVLIIAGGIAQTEFMIRSSQISTPDRVVITALLLLGISYGLNRRGYFRVATILALTTFMAGIFITKYLSPGNANGISVLFYLIIPILMGEFFLSLRGYLVLDGLILGGILSLVSINLETVDIFFFFLIFSALVGVASVNRRRIQRERQAALRRDEERYRSVISAMAEGIVVQSADGTIQAFNASAEQILGLSADQPRRYNTLNPRGRAIHEDGSDFPDEDHPAMVTLRSGEPQKGVIMGVHKLDGSLTWLSINTQPLFKADKTSPDAVVATFTDITREYELLLNEKRHARQMKLLNEIINTALETSDLSQMLQIFADRLGDLLEADGAYITFWDEARGLTIPAAAYGTLRDTYSTFHAEPSETTMTESVLKAGGALVIEDVLNTPYLSPRIAAFFPTRSMLALPLIIGNQKLGAALIAFNQRHTFTPQEITISEQAARQVALAVAKAQVFEAERRRASQLSLLEEASHQIAGLLDVRKICQQVMQTIVRSFGFAEAALLLSVKHDEIELELIALGGTEDMGIPPDQRVRKEGIIGHVATSRQVYIAADVSHDPYYINPPRGPRIGSAIGVPMLHEDDLLGVLYVESLTPNDFDTNIAQTLQTLASHTVTAIQRARLFAVADERLRTLVAVQSISQTVNSSLELEQIFQTVVELLHDTFGYRFVSIYLLDGKTLHLGAQIGYPLEMIYTEIAVPIGIAGRTVQSGQIQFIPNVHSEPGFLRAAHEVESEICVPLLKEGIVLGVLNVESERGRPLTEKDVNLMTSFAGPVAVAVENARLHSTMKSLALTDPLTALANRRAFDYALESEVARVIRYGPPLALVILDIDSFKTYNDTWGHPAGDVRLRGVADLLRANVRHPDIAARYGGEEFALLLPFTDKAGALLLAERLRAAAEANAPQETRSGTVIPGHTLSLGVAAFPEDGKTAAELLVAADNAELVAKRLGKNRVFAANSSHKLPSV